MITMDRSSLLARQTGYIGITLQYQIGGIAYPIDNGVYNSVLYFIPAPLSLTALSVTDGVSPVQVVNVAATPITVECEASRISEFTATLANNWTQAQNVSFLFVNGVDTILYTLYLTLAAGTWTCDVYGSIASEIRTYWQAGKAPGTVRIRLNVTDTWGNMYALSERALMPLIELKIVDHIVPTVDISAVESFALQSATAALDPESTYALHVFVAVPTGEAYIRKVIMYLSPTAISGSSLAAWNAAGAQMLEFSLISAATGEWMAVLPAQASGANLRWAVYVIDYAGNNNSASLTTSSITAARILVYAADPTAAIEAPVGYVLLGVMAFGLIFAISYRVQQGVQSVKKAKKVSAAVKKAAPGKTIGGTGTKSPISKDIPTKSCPICKAKIGADLDECPYCHKKF